MTKLNYIYFYSPLKSSFCLVKRYNGSVKFSAIFISLRHLTVNDLL